MRKELFLKKLIFLTVLFVLGTILSDIFVNIYIWRLKYNFVLISIYLISCYAVIPFIFYFSGYIAKNFDRVYIYKTGILFYIIFYLSVLIYNEKVTEHLIFIGVLKGFAMGFYWFGYHILTIDYTSSNNRDWFYSRLGIISGISSMICPLIAGYITKTLPGFKGYYLIFGISTILFVIAIILSTSLTSTPIKKPYKIKDLIFTKDKNWRGTMWAYFFLAGKDSISMFLIALLVVKATGSEFSFGKFAFLISTLTIITSYIIGKISKPHTRRSYVLSGSIIYFLSAFLLLYKIDFSTLIIYGILTAISDYLIRIPLSAYSLDIICLDANAHERKMEYIVARDIPIAIGRILTLFVFIIFIKNFDETGIKLIILLISTFPFFIYKNMPEKI